MARRVHIGAWALLACVGVSPARAESLAAIFRSPTFANLGLAPVGAALAATVAAEYPVASASSSVVYRYDAASDTMERRAGIAGPLFGERAETIGRGFFDLSLTYSYIHFTTINGDDLD